jgi:hypothetical protein
MRPARIGALHERTRAGTLDEAHTPAACIDTNLSRITLVAQQPLRRLQQPTTVPRDTDRDRLEQHRIERGDDAARGENGHFVLGRTTAEEHANPKTPFGLHARRLASECEHAGARRWQMMAMAGHACLPAVASTSASLPPRSASHVHLQTETQLTFLSVRALFQLNSPGFVPLEG